MAVASSGSGLRMLGADGLLCRMMALGGFDGLVGTETTGKAKIFGGLVWVGFGACEPKKATLG